MDTRTLENKIHSAIRNPLIGSVEFTDEEWEYIEDRCKETYEHVMKKPNKTFVPSLGMECIFLMIVRYASKWTGRESKFWSSIFEKIFDDSAVKQQNMYDAIEQVLAKNGAQGVFKAPSGRLFYSFFLYHAMAPRESIEAFITMLWRDFYLDEDLLNANYEQDNPLIPHLRKSLCKLFEKQEMLEKDIEFGKGKYSVRSGLKQAFLQRPEEEMIQFLCDILSRMDQLYYGNVQTGNDNLLIKMCDEIVTKLIYIERNQSDANRIRRRPLALPDISRVSASYRLERENGPVIALPKMRVLDTVEDYAILRLYSGDRMILEKRLPVLGTELKRMMEPIQISLNDHRRALSAAFLLRVEISIDGKVCFDSKKSLYREFLLFKDGTERNGHVLAPDTYEAYVPLKHKEAFLRCFSGQCGNETAGCIPVCCNEGDSFAVNGLPVLFSAHAAEMRLHLSGEFVKEFSWNYENNAYKVYHSMPTINFGPSRETELLGTYGVFHNDTYCGPLKSMVEACERDYWKLSADQFEGFSHHVEIRDMKNGKTLTEKYFCICKDARLLFEHCYGTGEKYCYHDKTQLSFLWNGEKYFAPIRTNGDYLPFQTEGGSLQLNPPRLKWRIDQGGWNHQNSRSIMWYRSLPLHNNALLETDVNFEAEISLWLGEQPVAAVGGSKPVFRLGDAITQWSNAEDTVVLVVNDERHELFRITQKPRLIADPEINFENGILSFDAIGCILGEDDMRLCMTLTQNSDDEDNEPRQYCFDQLCLRDQRETNIEDDFYDCQIDLIINRLTGEKRRLATLNDVPIGNPYLHMYDNEVLILRKTNHLDPQTGNKQSLKINQCSIRDICFSELGLEPIYRAKLCTPLQKAFDVEISIVDDTLNLLIPEHASYSSIVVKEYEIKGKKKKAFAIATETTESSSDYICGKLYYEFED